MKIRDGFYIVTGLFGYIRTLRAVFSAANEGVQPLLATNALNILSAKNLAFAQVICKETNLLPMLYRNVAHAHKREAPLNDWNDVYRVMADGLDTTEAETIIKGDGKNIESISRLQYHFGILHRWYSRQDPRLQDVLQSSGARGKLSKDLMAFFPEEVIQEHTSQMRSSKNCRHFLGL